MHRKTVFLTIIVLLIVAASLFFARDAIRSTLFNVTGEENLLAQARGLIDYATNLMRPMPNTADDAVSDEAGVSPFGINTLLEQEVEPPALEPECNARHATLDELLAQSDIVTLHSPYSADSHHLIGAAQLARMKKSAILIHAARGGVVDDAALIAALNSGTIAAAGLDVFENEPKFNPEFLKLRNIVLAPHIASATTNTRRNMAMLAARNLVAALTGERPPNLLNPDALK